MSAPPLIAVIDDDESVRVSLEGLVRSLGHRVCSFASAEAYLGARTASDCVISDVQMPGGMDGIELIEALAASGDPVPVILITAFADAPIKARAEKAGAAGFLKKPFDGAKLIDCLNEALGL